MTGTLILPDWLIAVPGEPPKPGWSVRVVGADADVVIFDPEREVILTQGDGMHGAGAHGRAPL